MGKGKNWRTPSNRRRRLRKKRRLKQKETPEIRTSVVHDTDLEDTLRVKVNFHLIGLGSILALLTVGILIWSYIQYS